MNDGVNPDFYFTSPYPSCPIPWPQTPQQARVIAVMYLVTWTTGLAFLLWKDRDSFRVGFVLIRCLVRWGIRALRAAWQDSVKEQDVAQTRSYKQKGQE